VVVKIVTERVSGDTTQKIWANF